MFLQTDGLGPGISGAATITSNVPVGASAIFTVFDSTGQFQTEAGVGDSLVSAALTLPVDITGGYNTGVAFFNPGSNAISLTFRLLDGNGVQLNATNRLLGARNHLADFVNELFPGTSDLRGSLAVSAPGGVAAMTLRQYGPGASYTTLPTAIGAAMGKAATPPLLPTTQTGLRAVFFDPDVAVSPKLVRGLRLSGTISGAGRLLQVSASAGNNDVYVGSIDPLTEKYMIVVPPGTYNLTTCYQPVGVPAMAALTLTAVEPAPIEVLSDTVRQITLAPASLAAVSGTVSGLSSLPVGANPTLVFTSGDNAIQGRFPLDASGSYQGLLPAGNYQAGLSEGPIQFSPLQQQTMGIYDLGSLTVGAGAATGNYAIPPASRLSGGIRGGGLANLPPGTTVTAADTSAPTVIPTRLLYSPSSEHGNFRNLGFLSDGAGTKPRLQGRHYGPHPARIELYRPSPISPEFERDQFGVGYDPGLQFPRPSGAGGHLRHRDRRFR